MWVVSDLAGREIRNLKKKVSIIQVGIYQSADHP